MPKPRVRQGSYDAQQIASNEGIVLAPGQQLPPEWFGNRPPPGYAYDAVGWQEPGVLPGNEAPAPIQAPGYVQGGISISAGDPNPQTGLLWDHSGGPENPNFFYPPGVAYDDTTGQLVQQGQPFDPGYGAGSFVPNDTYFQTGPGYGGNEGFVPNDIYSQTGVGYGAGGAFVPTDTYDYGVGYGAGGAFVPTDTYSQPTPSSNYYASAGMQPWSPSQSVFQSPFGPLDYGVLGGNYLGGASSGFPSYYADAGIQPWSSSASIFTQPAAPGDYGVMGSDYTSGASSAVPNVGGTDIAGMGGTTPTQNSSLSDLGASPSSSGFDTSIDWGGSPVNSASDGQGGYFLYDADWNYVGHSTTPSVPSTPTGAPPAQQSSSQAPTVAMVDPTPTFTFYQDPMAYAQQWQQLSNISPTGNWAGGTAGLIGSSGVGSYDSTLHGGMTSSGQSFSGLGGSGAGGMPSITISYV